MSEKIKALLATGRISNLPTVWCNCLAAGLLLYFSDSSFQIIHSNEIESPNGAFIIVTIILVFSSSMLYVGGCFLGDAIDSNFDKKNKPDRPIPNGTLNRKFIFITAWIMLLIGLILPTYFHFQPNPTFIYLYYPKAADYGWQQMTAVPFLFAAIVLYSIYHKRYPVIGLPLIGLCRFFLVIFGASIVTWMATNYKLIDEYLEIAITTPYLTTPIILYASAVCLYTICFASVARTESSDSPITWRNILRYTMLGLPFVALISRNTFHGGYLQIAALVAFAVYALWLLRAFQFLEKNKGVYVSKCLAGFCLLDACFVAQFGWPWFIICLVLFGLALLLQKIAPAT